MSFCVYVGAALDADNRPNEYKKFLRQYQDDEDENRKTIWISKPADLSRGRGIYLFKSLHELTYDC
ncbi:putative tubulin polyglutamylase ttll2, partial [Kappamyces sp. JEL0680]